LNNLSTNRLDGGFFYAYEKAIAMLVPIFVTCKRRSAAFRKQKRSNLLIMQF
jgi:hypothetical protein